MEDTTTTIENKNKRGLATAKRFVDALLAFQEDAGAATPFSGDLSQESVRVKLYWLTEQHDAPPDGSSAAVNRWDELTVRVEHSYTFSKEERDELKDYVDSALTARFGNPTHNHLSNLLVSEVKVNERAA